ncbi:MAG TPA: DEAD/DEAH box helicase family protein [Paludibacter sp.]
MKKQDRQDYLSNYFTELPSNCVLNKVATGCGGTSLEIENMNRDSIIAVPLEQMISNKVGQYPNDRTPDDFKLFGVCDGVLKEDLINYLKTNKVHKIIVTYDSLPRVIEAINELKERQIEEYFLLIDEVHYIMNNYQLRKDAINKLLAIYPLFKNWCFMTATPNEEEFTLEELKDIPVIVAPFELEMIHIENIQTIQVEATIKKLINRYLNSKFQNAHIFVNSVEIIARLVKACNLTNDNCRAVWSKRNKSYKTTIHGIHRSKVGSDPKKINFYTSTCFEGSDIKDEEGQYIIVSDGSKAHTLNDISTSFRQIMGRIRNTKYRNDVTHIFKGTRYSEIKSYTEYKAYTIRLLKDAEKLINAYNELSEHKLKEDALNEYYITLQGNKYLIDKNLIKYDLMKYKLANETNASIAIIKQAQERNGFTARNSTHNLQPSDFLKLDNEAKIKFRDAFKEYSDLREEMKTTLYNSIAEQRFQILEQAYNFLGKAYDVLGENEVKNLNYNQTSIKRKLIALSDKSNSNKIARILNKSGIKTNEFIPLVDAKNKLKEAYKLVKIDKQPKASDLNNYYMTESLSKRLNGEIVHGLKIIREKFVFN